MTREQYETAMKAIIEATNNILRKAKTTEEKLNAIEGQAFQIQVITNAYLGK